MSGPMYFKPTDADIADAAKSNCKMATPRDSSNCIGSHCHMWDNGKCQSLKTNVAQPAKDQA